MLFKENTETKIKQSNNKDYFRKISFDQLASATAIDGWIEMIN